VTDFFRSRIQSFNHAFAGLRFVLKTQKNAWIHTIATIITISFAIWLQIDLLGFAVLILTIGTVWTAEFVHTALEAVVDLASPQKHPLAKVGKDVGAAAVLIAALSSVIIGFVILGPALIQKLGW
jgi:diacylglycerol kinase